MAEIPVERKSGSKWWLWLILLLLAVALIWWLLAEGDDPEVEAVDTVAVEESADLDSVDAAATGEMTLAASLANPSSYYGMEGFTGEVEVGGPLTDRGFWIENEGARMFAIVIDDPAERPIDINPGATLRLNGGTVRDPATISAADIEGDALDEDTMNAISDQEAVLLIDESNMEITDAA